MYLRERNTNEIYGVTAKHVAEKMKNQTCYILLYEKLGDATTATALGTVKFSPVEHSSDFSDMLDIALIQPYDYNESDLVKLAEKSVSCISGVEAELAKPELVYPSAAVSKNLRRKVELKDRKGKILPPRTLLGGGWKMDMLDFELGLGQM